jgi:ribonuclease P protein component
VLGRIVRSEDFERVLSQPARARSPHFAVHFASGQPSRPGKKPGAAPSRSEAAGDKLSTDGELPCQQPVDDRVPADRAHPHRPQAWLGAVVPKRHARRAVTRTLIKRQIRSAARRVEAAANGLEPGLWVVRLRAPFDRGAFPSAASGALRSAARVEIDALLSKCGART